MLHQLTSKQTNIGVTSDIDFGHVAFLLSNGEPAWQRDQFVANSV